MASSPGRRLFASRRPGSTRMKRRTTTVVVAAALALAGCSGDAKPQPRPIASHTPQLAPPFEKKAEPAEAVLSLVPQSADVITVTDWDAIRVQLGQPELTSESLVTDR